MSNSPKNALFQRSAHSPSFFDVKRSMAGRGVDLIDFCIPCNPYFPTPQMFAKLSRNIVTMLKYYPSDNETIARELASVLRLQPQNLVLANGSTELLTWIDRLFITESLATPIPTFGRWTDQPLETGKRLNTFQLEERDSFQLDTDRFVEFVNATKSRAAVICNPNNPDGNYLPRHEVLYLLDRLSHLDVVVIDESFIDFIDEEELQSVANIAASRGNVIVLKSLGKNFGLHGVRFGYVVTNPHMAAQLRDALPKWNINSVAESIIFSLKENMPDYYASLPRIAEDRRSMFEALREIPGLKVYPSQGNFILVRLPEGLNGVDCRDHLLNEHAIFTRECGNKKGMTSQFIRLVVRPAEDVARLVAGLKSYVALHAALAPAPVAQVADTIPPPSGVRSVAKLLKRRNGRRRPWRLVKKTSRAA